MTLVQKPAATEERIPERHSRVLATFQFHDFRFLWFGLLVSNLGTWMQITTLGYLVVKISATPQLAALNVGLLGASVAVPVLLLSPFAGVAADRFPRRRVLFVTNGVTAALALILALLSSFGWIALWNVLLISALRASVASFDAPARQSWVPLLVPREYVGNAIGLNSLAFNAPSVIGPPIAGFLILSVGIAVSFYINAISTVAVLVALANMQPSPPSSTRRESVLASILAGLRFLFNDPTLRWVLVVLTISCALVRPYIQLLPAYAAHVLFVDARGLGFLLAASGVGAIFGSILTAMIGDRRRGTVWFASAALMGLCAIGFGFTSDFRVAIAIAATMGLATLSFAGSSNVLLQTHSPDDMRGRAISVFSMIILGLVPGGSFLLGSLATFVGLAHAMALGGAVALVATSVIFISHRTLRAM